jgi:hypothetical protein
MEKADHHEKPDQENYANRNADDLQHGDSSRLNR